MPVRPERKDAAEHRKLILRTAYTLFNMHGIDQVSMHQIAKTAGIGQGTLYRRYTHKGELCLDLFKERCRIYMEAMTESLAEAAERPIADRLSILIDVWLNFIEEHLSWIGVLQQDKSCEQPNATYYQAPIYVYMHEAISSLVNSLPVDSHLKTAYSDSAFAAHAVLASLDPKFYALMRLELQQSPEQIKHNLLQYLLPIFH